MIFKKQDKPKDNSPNGLELPKADSRKNGTKYIGIITVVVICMVGILYFSLTNSGSNTSNEIEQPTLETENKPLMPIEESFGVASLPTEQPLIDNQQDEKEEFRINVITDNDSNAEEALRREQEEMRRLKLQQSQSALSSSMLISRKGIVLEPEQQNASSRPAETGGFSGSEYDPAANMDKEAFFERADTTKRDGWISPYTREKGRLYELKTGAIIPGSMVGGINSDLPGILIGQVTQNVYDTATGKHLLIPQGAKLYGVYDSRVVYGQERVLIAWNRILFPDGSTITLGAMPGSDAAGYSGFSDKVDNHYLRIFGSAFMMSLVAGGMSYAVDQASNSDSDSNKTTMQDEMTSALAAQMGQAAMALLQKNLSIAPTLKIRFGYKFNIVVTKDLVFAGPYDRR